MRPELTGCIQLPTGAVKLQLTPATQTLIWRCHFSLLAFVLLPSSIFLPCFSHVLYILPSKTVANPKQKVYSTRSDCESIQNAFLCPSGKD